MSMVEFLFDSLYFLNKYVFCKRLNKCLFTHADCQINVNGGLGAPQPLILIPGTTTFRNPQSRSGIISLSTGESVELFCTSSTTATCQSNGQFLIDGANRNFNEYTCSKLPTHSVRSTGRACFGGANILEVGFDLGGGRFASTMEMCHDPNVQVNHWVFNKLTPSHDGFQSGFPRPTFKTGGFFGGKNVDNLYTKNNQIQVFTQILGSQAIAESLVKQTGDVYLARGHQAPKADYIFGSQQDATFYFVNVGPQWQAFNAYNWERVEDGVRTMAADRGKYLDLYTGQFGVMTYADAGGVQRELYLDISSGHGQIPVPKIFYKVVLEPATGLGIVFIGVNNVHATLAEIQSSYIFCNDVADRINWIKWDIHNIQRGYMYACDVNQFAQVVGHLPGVGASGLLV